MTDHSIESDLLSACTAFLESHSDLVDDYIELYPENAVFEIPLETLREADSDLESVWREYPDQLTSHITDALVDFVDEDSAKADLPANTIPRITGYDSDYVFDVGRYRPDDVAGRVIHIRGQVTKRSKRKLRDEVVAFKCSRCGRVIEIPQSGPKLQEPHQCPGCERQGPFDTDPRRTEMRDFQHIRLQTMPEHSERGETEMIDMEVYDDLVGELKPGDRAILNVRMVARRENPDSRERTLEGKVLSVDKLTGDHADVDIEPHEEAIRENANSDDPYTPVWESVAPRHEGDLMVKKAIGLQLFGGIDMELDDGTTRRGNSHILLMGDPGSGKTAILKYVTNLVPRAEYATGKSTSAGLTGTAQQDEFADGGWILQAGTLVKASGGLACVDELDKMDSDEIPGFMEALSDQQVTITMVISGVLPAKTAVLAAANPKYGTFDPMADIGQQLDLSEVLLSRFDLWFMMRDEPDEELDEDIARSQTETARIGQKQEKGEELTTEEREESSPPIPPEMFRAYVAMAKQVSPVFTRDAEDRIVKEYVELRQVNDGDGPIPATARIVEGIHRLSEASARIRLSDEVTVDDVERALEVLYHSLETLGMDPESGELDARKFETGTPTSKKDREKAVLGIIKGKETDESPAPLDAVKEEAMVLMDEDQFESILDKLAERGDVYRPEKNTLRVV